MDIEKAKRLLAKINVLVENMDDSFSTLENDLLRTYIKDLYECVSGMDPAMRKPEPQKRDQQKPAKQLPEKETDVRESKIEDEPHTPPEFRSTTRPAETDEHDVALESTTIRDDIADTAESTQANGEQESVQEQVPVMEASINSTASPELEALFVLPRGEDIASKLSAKPIRLVEEAMGINDRISTINELFGKDHELFQETLKKVNGFETYDQARQFLITGVALTQEWSSEEKAERAIEFIRLIGRKFQSN